MSIHTFDAKAVTGLENLAKVLTGDSGKESLIKLFAAVAWLYRGVTILENAIQAMPFEVYKGDNLIYSYDMMGRQERPPLGLEWLVKLPALSAMAEGAMLLTGKAYVFNSRNAARTLSLQWLKPGTVEPVYDKATGELIRFDRKLAEQIKPKPLEVQDVIYFWPSDKFVENGPAENFPGKAALSAANIIYNEELFINKYFSRGMIRASVLKYKDRITEQEANRAKEWFSRVLLGRQSAFSAQVLRNDMEIMQIGDGLKDLENTALTTEERENIATALGVPQSKLAANAANFATKKSDDLMMIQDTVIPACSFIASVWNEQFFMPRNLMLVYTPQRLAIMQEDENERSVAFRNYVGSDPNKGYSVKEAEQILGISSPVIEEEETAVPIEPSQQKQYTGVAVANAIAIVREAGAGTISRENAIAMYGEFIGVPPDLASAMIPEVTQIDTKTNPITEDQLIAALDRREEIQRFTRWLAKRENPNPDHFDSKILTREDKYTVYKVLKQQIQPDGFVPGEDFQNITDEDIEAALKLWNELFPEYQGLLEADVV